MNRSTRNMALLILFAFGIFCANAKAQQQPNRLRDRQVSVILQRLEQSSNSFHNSLNVTLMNGRIDETQQHEINSFEPALSSAIDQFRNKFSRREAAAADVQNSLQKAYGVNVFMTRNQLNLRVQNDWTAERTNLNALANAYSLSWQWSQENPPPMSSNKSLRLSDSELNQLIRRIAAGGEIGRASCRERG